MATDIIIIGGGPVGVTAAHLLASRGLSTLVIERETALYDLPRAIHMDHEIMRIFQSAGLADLLLPYLAIPQGSVHFGADGAPIRPFRRMSPTGKYGWAGDYFYYQPDLEGALRLALTERSGIEFLSGHTVVGIQETIDGVTVEAESASGLIIAEARYVLACDGARSTVRGQLGIGLVDLGFDEPWIVVDAIVPGKVAMPAFSGLPDDVDVQKVMFIIGDPARPTTYVPSTGNHRRWEFMLLPGEDAENAANPQMVAQLLSPWLQGEPHTVVRSAVYRFHSLLAERWQTSRIFLLGDAAHQTPPFFGQGLCHGIRDAANIAWKLDLVVHHAADPSLLSTYEVERMPHARAVIEASMRTGRYICTLDPEAALRRDVAMRSAAPGTSGDIIPSLGAGILDPRLDHPAIGVRFIQPYVTDSSGQIGLLDDFTGTGFLIISTAEDALVRCGETGSEIGLGKVLILAPGKPASAFTGAVIDHDSQLCRWLASFDCVGLILRPDAYVYGTFATPEEATALVRGLVRQLSPMNRAEDLPPPPPRRLAAMVPS